MAILPPNRCFYVEVDTGCLTPNTSYSSELIRFVCENSPEVIGKAHLKTS
jgi:hypothetical protein